MDSRKEYVPILSTSQCIDKETRSLDLLTGDSRYELSIENGGWYTPCYVLRFAGVAIGHSDIMRDIREAAMYHIEMRGL
jgi:hypothetical protein